MKQNSAILKNPSPSPNKPGRIHSIETFGTVDGPGIRMVVFFQGCPLRCLYCHNPDSWNMTDGTKMSADEILDRFERNRNFYKNGGITATGGEPMVQMDFLLELFTKAKKRGIHTCLDTSGIAFPADIKNPIYVKIEKLMNVTDLILLDIKHIKEPEHQTLTGKSNRLILAFARYLSRIGKPVWIRHVLVPGINDSEEDLSRTADFIRTLKNVEKVEVLPYHTLGVFKWEELGYRYALTGVEPPSDESVAMAKRILSAE
jgi:pyruvate formate lyase activating enzyme